MINSIIRKLKKSKDNEVEKLQKKYNSLVQQAQQALLDIKVSEFSFKQAENTRIKTHKDVSYVDVAILTEDVANIRYRLLIKEAKEVYSELQSLKNKVS